MNYIRWYTQMLKDKPYITKSITSFFTFGLGDVLCQTVEARLSKDKTNNNSKKHLNIIRILKQGSFGILITPYYHLQYCVLMPKWFTGQGAKNTAKMILYDQAVNTVVVIAAFFTYMDYMNKANFTLRESFEDSKRKFPQTFIANFKLWPAAQWINFTIVPVEYRVLFINIVAIFWTTYLSYVQNSSKKPFVETITSEVHEASSEPNKH